MAQIVLTTLNARYIHAAFGLRYLLANLGPLRQQACLVEFDLQQRPLEVVESILAQDPQIVGLGVYIWNVSQATEVLAALKRVRPQVTVVLGGPEVSYETEEQEIVRLADYVIHRRGGFEICGGLRGPSARAASCGKNHCGGCARSGAPATALRFLQ